MGLISKLREGWAAGGTPESAEALKAKVAADKEARKDKQKQDWAEHKDRQAQRVQKMRAGRKTP